MLGGAVALLPVYAREILKTGPWGLGLLRCSPGIGAAIHGVLLAHRPLRGRCGVTMLWCVAGFGVFTILFGLSHSLAFSMIALVMVGATDMVSVMTRAILVQLATPDEMRGRVNAVDMIFIGASNELGQFESGLTPPGSAPCLPSCSEESVRLSSPCFGPGVFPSCATPPTRWIRPLTEVISSNRAC